MNDTQRCQIIRHLRIYGSITDLEAFADYGIRRLGARIYDLKKDGYPIKTEMVTGQNRFGQQTRYAKYIFLQDGEA